MFWGEAGRNNKEKIKYKLVKSALDLKVDDGTFCWLIDPNLFVVLFTFVSFFFFLMNYFICFKYKLLLYLFYLFSNVFDNFSDEINLDPNPVKHCELVQMINCCHFNNKKNVILYTGLSYHT